MILALAGLALAVTPVDPGPALIGGGHLPSAGDREWAVSRPNRGAPRAVAAAATVPPRYRTWAACVLDRESGGTLADPTSGAGALNGGGSGAQGRWQFMPAWNHGGPYMVRDRLVRHGMTPRTARTVRVYLSGRPIHRWPGVYQDALFNEAVTRGGAFHWSGHTCGLPR